MIKWCVILLHLRDGQVTEEDWQHLMNQTPAKVQDLEQFHNALHLYPTIDAAAELNVTKLHANSQPIATVNSLESVQKFALKLCTKNWNASYDETLSNCNLPTLAHRRRLLKLSFLFQIVHSNFVFPDAPIERRSLLLFNLRTFSITSLYRPAARTAAYQFSFFPHTIFLWNTLPSSVHVCNSLNSFKRKISRFNL